MVIRTVEEANNVRIWVRLLYLRCLFQFTGWINPAM
jgi:hypothetical protein